MLVEQRKLGLLGLLVALSSCLLLLEEMDDEIDAIITHYRERKQGIRDAHASRQRVQWVEPTSVGPTSKSEGV